MQISAAKVIKSLINLVYTLNLITIKTPIELGKTPRPGVPLFFQVRDLWVPKGKIPGTMILLRTPGGPVDPGWWPGVLPDPVQNSGTPCRILNRSLVLLLGSGQDL